MERTAADRVADPVIGRLLDGRYLVGERIARGGMATVYAASDTRLQRQVAVKVMHPGLGDDDTFSRRFRREAQAAARLAHQNVVAVFDQGDDDGVLFLVMEQVHGITLRDLIREEAPIAPIKALAVLEPVLAALASAHAGGMIHRDVKPENVLLSDDGRVKVADFGLARAVNAETQHTGTGVLIGTVSYLSPELVVAGEADARADVYAAGVLLYEMLTGRKPHQADSAIQVAYKHVHEDIPRPSALVPSLPGYVDALVARATARDVHRRPHDAGELLSMVRRVRSDLEAGVRDDPALVADLVPVPAPRDPFVDTDDQMPRVIIDPSDDTGGWSAVDEFGEARDGSYDPRHDAGAAVWDEPDVPTGAALTAMNHPDAFAPYTSTSARTADRGGQPPSLMPSGPARPAGQHRGEGPTDPGAEPTTDLRGRGFAVPPADRRTGSRQPPRRPVAPPPRRSPARRRRPVFLVLALVVVLVIGIGAWYFGYARYTTTPGVINVKQSTAQARVEKAGLTFEVARKSYSENVLAGSVISSDPEPGTRLLKSGTVSVVISRGPERHAVPDVQGMTLDQAQAAVQAAKLSAGRTKQRYDEKVPKGKVISTSPAIGSELRRDTAVDLVVSKGRKPINVPDYTGKSAADATKAIKGLGLAVTSTTAFDDTVPKGSVVSQDPRSGVLYRNDTVRLVVSKGPQLVAVPKVTAMSAADATKTLEAKGFKVKTKKSSQYVGLDYVIGSNPKAGEKIPKGSVVTIGLV